MTATRNPEAVTVNPSTISDAIHRPRAAEARKMNARMRKTTIGGAPSSSAGEERVPALSLTLGTAPHAPPGCDQSVCYE